SQRHAARLDLQRRHEWDHNAAFAQPLRGRTLAILGYGSIGREVARLAAAFGMRVLALKLRPDEHRDEGWLVPGLGDPDGVIPERIVGLDGRDEVLGEAEFVAIALPLTAATRNVLDREAIAAMRP